MHTYAQIYFSLAWAILFNTPPPLFHPIRLILGFENNGSDDGIA